jgi:hypothetical protein
MAGTLYVPSRHEELRIGVGGEQPHPNLWAIYTVPFAECYRLLRLGPAAALSFRVPERKTEMSVSASPPSTTQSTV